MPKEISSGKIPLAGIEPISSFQCSKPQMEVIFSVVLPSPEFQEIKQNLIKDHSPLIGGYSNWMPQEISSGRIRLAEMMPIASCHYSKLQMEVIFSVVTPLLEFQEIKQKRIMTALTL